MNNYEIRYPINFHSDNQKLIFNDKDKMMANKAQEIFREFL